MEHSNKRGSGCCGGCAAVVASNCQANGGRIFFSDYRIKVNGLEGSTWAINLSSLITFIDNVIRGFSGMLIAWGVLLPFLAIGAAILWRRHSAVKSSLIWMIPGFAYFLLYYIADASYFSFCVAPGLLIVGFLLRDLAKPLRSAVYSCAITASLLFIFLAHPIEPNSKPKAFLDAYFMKYSVWSLKHQYAPTLSDLLGVCVQKDVLGACK
jgi:hypothetical protein